MNELTGMPNVGAVLAKRLADAGIQTPSDLKALGSIEALLQVRAQTGDELCASMLYALEGAIRGVRWHAIAPEERAELWRRYLARSRNGEVGRK